MATVTNESSTSSVTTAGPTSTPNVTQRLTTPTNTPVPTTTPTEYLTRSTPVSPYTTGYPSTSGIGPDVSTREIPRVPLEVIIGGAVGGFLVIMIIVGVVIFVIWWRKRRDKGARVPAPPSRDDLGIQDGGIPNGGFITETSNQNQSLPLRKSSPRPGHADRGEKFVDLAVPVPKDNKSYGRQDSGTRRDYVNQQIIDWLHKLQTDGHTHEAEQQFYEDMNLMTEIKRMVPDFDMTKKYQNAEMIEMLKRTRNSDPPPSPTDDTKTHHGYVNKNVIDKIKRSKSAATPSSSTHTVNQGSTRYPINERPEQEYENMEVGAGSQNEASLGQHSDSRQPAESSAWSEPTETYQNVLIARSEPNLSHIPDQPPSVNRQNKPNTSKHHHDAFDPSRSSLWRDEDMQGTGPAHPQDYPVDTPTVFGRATAFQPR